MQHFYQNIQGWFDYSDLYGIIISKMPNDFKFAEIGVWKGKSLSYFVVEAINSGKNFKAYAIDTFDGRGTDPREFPKEKGLYNVFLENIEPIKEHINIIKNTSFEASNLFIDNYFDAIFIDASHDYSSVSLDINSWFPKVKNKIIYGHDFGIIGVNRAVIEFANKNKLSHRPISKNCWVLS